MSRPRGSSRLRLRSPAELAGAGTPRGGYAGGLPQPRFRPLRGASPPPPPPPPLGRSRAAGSACRLCARRTCRREDEPEGHAGASVCRGVGRWGLRGATPGARGASRRGLVWRGACATAEARGPRPHVGLPARPQNGSGLGLPPRAPGPHVAHVRGRPRFRPPLRACGGRASQRTGKGRC